MPWDISQVDEHKKGLTDRQKRQWVEIANSVLTSCTADGGTESDCAAKAIRQANGAVGPTDNCLTIMRANATAALIRTETFENRNHLVVPVVLLTEGVHNGSAGPVYYPADELAKFPDAWNGIPIPVYHPTNPQGTPVSCNSPRVIESNVVGRLFNVQYRDRKLVGEMWLDEGKLRVYSPETVRALEAGRLEVSTGLFSDNEKITGTFNGKDYAEIARNIRPDHLAVLPNATGACSWASGCGAPRINQNKEGTYAMNKDKGFIRSAIDKLSSLIGLRTNEMSHDDLRWKLQKAIDAMDSSMVVHFMREVYDGYFIYEAAPGMEALPTAESKIFKRSYTVDEETKGVELSDDAQEVVMETTYKPVTNAGAASPDTNQGAQTPRKEGGHNKMTDTNTKQPCCPEKVAALIANEHTPFIEADREQLSALPEAMVDKMLEQMKMVEPKQTQNQEPTNKKEPEDKQKPVTLADLLANAEPDERESIVYGKKLYQEKKDALVTKITANSQAFAKEELSAKSLDELDKLASLIQGGDYSLSGGPAPTTHAKKEEPLGLPTFNAEKK